MNKPWRLYLWVIAVFALSFTGCAQAVTPSAGETFEPPGAAVTETPPANGIISTSTGEPAQMNPSPTPPQSAGLESLIQQAVRDLAARLSIPEDQIQLVSAEAVVWPDASLGCPQPEMAYIQIPFDGSLIILRAGERTYEYHAGGKRGLFLCEGVKTKPGKPAPIDLSKSTPPAPDQGIPPGADQ